MLKQFLTSMLLTAPVFAIFAMSAHSYEITPQTKPDCAQVVCTEDGVQLPPAPPIVLPEPYVGDESIPVENIGDGFVRSETLVPCKIDGKVIKGCWLK